jgi:hypothetical protein
MLTVSQIIAANNLDRELRKSGSALNERDLPPAYRHACETQRKDLAEACKDVFAENEKSYLKTAMKG